MEGNTKWTAKRILAWLCVLMLMFGGEGGLAESVDGAIFGVGVVTQPTEKPSIYGWLTGRQGLGDAGGNVLWTEYEADGVRTLVFTVADATRPAAERAVTQLLDADGKPASAQLRETTNRIVFEEGVSGAGWTYQFQLNDGEPAWPAAYPVDPSRTDVFNGFKALTEVVPCESLERIGWSAFKDCGKLSAFDFTKCPNLVEVMNQAFYNCSSLDEVDLSACASLVTLGWSAFNGAGRGKGASLTLPVSGSLSVIGGHAFEGFGRATGGMKVDFSGVADSLTGILQDAFSGSSVSAALTGMDNLAEIGAGAFRGSRVTEISLGGGSLSAIGDEAFSGCANLTDAVLPASLARIGERAFSGCASLASVSFEDAAALAQMGESAFDGAASLAMVADAAAGAQARSTVKAAALFVNAATPGNAFDNTGLLRPQETVVEVKAGGAPLTASFTGELPDNAVIEMKPLTVVKNRGAKGPDNPAGETILSFDITILDREGKVWEPEEPVTVSFTSELISRAAAEGLSLVVVHTLDDGTQETIIPAVSGDSLSFDAASFSGYSVTGFLDLAADWLWQQALNLTQRVLKLVTDTFTVQITGTMPRNATAKAVEETPVIEGQDVLWAADLTLYNYGTAIQPNWGALGVTVTSEEIAAAIEAGYTLTVYHQDEKGLTALDESSFTVTVDAVQFEAEHFSEYILTGSDAQEAQSLTAEGGKVTLSGAMPVHASMNASPVAPSTAANGDGEPLFSYDLTLYNYQTPIQPKQPLIVTMRDDAVAAAVAAGKGVEVWHVSTDDTGAETREKIQNVTIEGDAVSFAAESFSVYEVVQVELSETVTASDGNTYEIKVTYGSEAGIPMRGTALQAREILPTDAGYDFYVRESMKAVGTDADHMALARAFDIKVVDAADPSRVYEPSGDVEVSIRLVGSTLTDYADVSVLHFGEGNSVSEMDATVSEETVSFTTDSFSVYLVGGQVHVRTFKFYVLNEYLEYEQLELNTDTENPTYEQVVRSGEWPVAPHNPINPQDAEATFVGWFEGNGTPETTQTELRLLNKKYDFSKPVEPLDQDDVVHLHAVFSSYHYVIFHDQYDAEIGDFPVAFTRRIDTNSTDHNDWYVNLYQYRISYEDPNEIDDTQMVFVGWSRTPITTPNASVDDNGDPVTPVHTDDQGRLEVDATMDLYPIFRAVKWLNYYTGPSGSHATYFTNTYHYDGEGPERLPGSAVYDDGNGTHYPAMTRDPNSQTKRAYQFMGWYANVSLTDGGEVDAASLAGGVMIADANGILVKDAAYKPGGTGIEVVETCDRNPNCRHIHLTSPINTLYAVWAPADTADYSIVIVTLKAQDGNTTEYEYEEKYTHTGTIGDPIAWDPNYETLNTAAGYNALHPGLAEPLTDENNAALNPYSAYYYHHTSYDPNSPTTIKADGSTKVYVYYNWSTTPNLANTRSNLYFVDSLLADDGTRPTYRQYVKTEGTEDGGVLYGESLENLKPASPISQISEEGLTFTGWYAEETCTTRVFFSKTETITEGGVEYTYDTYPGGVLFDTMPATDLTIYAGWTREWFLVRIDPNYGELYKRVGNDFSGEGSTWFWKEYGDTFQEYTGVKRDYVESDSGSWYYVKHDWAHYGYPDPDDPSYDPNMPESRERKTYYTQTPNEATELTTFEYNPKVYRYAGWYEVYPDGTEASERYDFGSIVDHNITLRLRWMKTGLFYLQYVPGEGTLNEGDANEALYLELDNNAYSDDADVVVNRVATPPEGYEFTGWRIRQDDSGAIYRPGQTFHLLSKYMATVQDKRTVFLDAVYEKVPTATIVYHANGGTPDWSAVDYGYPVDQLLNPNPQREYSNTAETATISQIANNSQFVLSNGSSWLRRDGAVFVGWCENPDRVFDEAKEDVYPLLNPGLPASGADYYRVGANQGETPEDTVVHLYAIWAVNVNYHLYHDGTGGVTADANFGGDWNEPFRASGIHVYEPYDTTNNTTDLYTQTNVLIGSEISWPKYDPVYTGSDGKTFLYWAVYDNNHVLKKYDFAQPVEGALDLYAVWAHAYETTVKVVDSSAAANEDKTSAWTPEDGGRHGVIKLGSAKQTPQQIITASGFTVPSGYVFAFATVAKDDPAMMQHILEKPIHEIYYKAQDGKVHLSFESAPSTDVVLGDDELIYFVFYEGKALKIGYIEVQNSGKLKNLNAPDGAPTSTTPLGVDSNGVPVVYNMAQYVYQPMAWMNNTSYSVYSYAIGKDSITDDVTDAVDLMLKTNAFPDDSNVPHLHVRRTWRGIQYCRDEGDNPEDWVHWVDIGYDVALYVAYYYATPTFVTFDVNVVGLPADKIRDYSFDYWIEKISLTDRSVIEKTFTTIPGAPGNGTDTFLFHGDGPVTIKEHGAFSTFLLTETTGSAPYTFRVTIAQRPVNAFACNVAASVPADLTFTSGLQGWDPALHDAGRTYAYTAYDASNSDLFGDTVDSPDYGGTHYIHFENTREYVDMQIHVAKVEVTSGIIYYHPEWRSNTPADYTVHLTTNDAAVNLPVEYPSDRVGSNAGANYGFGGVLYGRDSHVEGQHGAGDDDTVSVKADAPFSSWNYLSMELADPGDPSVYGIYLKKAADSTGDDRYNLEEMAEQLAWDIPMTAYKVYYLYYPELTVHYVLEDSDGNLSLIQGATPGEITYNGSPLELNGIPVTRTQAVKMPLSGLTISQEIGNDQYGYPIFNIPPLLDDGDAKLNLVYYKLGAASQQNFADVMPDTSSSSFPGRAGNGYVDNEGKVYDSGITEELALYTEIHDNKLSWKFADEPDWGTINNWPVVYAIYRERGYNLTVAKTVGVDTGYDEPFIITVSSSSINRASYPVEGTGYSSINASIENGVGTITFEVKDGDRVTIHGLATGDYIITETGNENFVMTATVTPTKDEGDENHPPVPLIVDNNSVISLTDANKLTENTTLALTNMPEYICRTKGSNKKYRTLTQAINDISEFDADFTETIEMLVPNYLMPASDTPEIPAYLNVTITTAEPDADDPYNKIMAGQNAVITRKANLTGPMFTNLGELTLTNITLDGNATDENNQPRGAYPAALINNENTLTIAEGARLQNAHNIGKGGAIYNYKGDVNVSGGLFSGCQAEQGGAIFAETGYVNVSGGVMEDNQAVEGGAIYYAGKGDVNISGGTIGNENHPNIAENGGAVYMASGTINITGGAIQYNVARGSASTDPNALDTGCGGGVYALNAYANISGDSTVISHNTASVNGGGFHMQTLKLVMTGGTLSYNRAADGGAVWTATGSVEMSGGSMSNNSAIGMASPDPNDPSATVATGGCGGAVYARSSEFNMTGGRVEDNTARESGGGVYTESGAVTVKNSGSAMTGNKATTGDGGGVYAGSGAVTVENNVGMHGNEALAGRGGALYLNTGSASLTNAKFGAQNNANKAVNGAAIFIGSGAATFKNGSVRYNEATEGGAVGVGSADARLNFDGNVVIADNKMTTSGLDANQQPIQTTVASNVYLNFDTDAILNFQSLGSSGNIGVHAADVQIPGESETVLDRRGVPSTRFGVYVGSVTLNKIHNDRTPNLTVAKDSTNKKLYWVRNFNIKVYYVADYTNGLPYGDTDYTTAFYSTTANTSTSNGGIFIRKADGTPPSYRNAASELAEDIRRLGAVAPSGNQTAVFGNAFVQGNSVADMHYSDYLTRVDWNTDTNLWEFAKRDGSYVPGGTNPNAVKTLIFIYTEPYYLSIENNAKDSNDQGMTLVISGLNVTVNGAAQSVIDNYGYVFARNDEIQNELMPVQPSDLVLEYGESVRIMLPGGKGMNYSLTGDYYAQYDEATHTGTPATGSVSYRKKETTDTTGSVEATGFTVTGVTPSASGGTSELIFGGERSICRVVADSQIPGALPSEYVDMSEGEGATAGKWEYTFKSPEKAYLFIEKYKTSFPDGADATKVKATIEFLVDYMYPSSEQVLLSTGGSVARDITFQTAVNGHFRYHPGETSADGSAGAGLRAVVSRGADNNESFFRAKEGTLTGANYVDSVTMKNLVFDGKSFGGDKISGGILRTKGWNVAIDNVDFNNCSAQFGGGMYIESVNKSSSDKRPYGSLVITNSNFTNCQSTASEDKYGGGGVWTSMKDVTIRNCNFTACVGVRQGGGVFHYLGGNYESSTTVENCRFESCKSQAAGSIESGAKRVLIKNTVFRNSTATDRNGGAVNVWALDQKTPSTGWDCWVTLEDCEFENCYALNGTGDNGNGGAMRSTARYNTIKNCTFTNALGNNGGAINIFNSNAVDTVVSGCTFNSCSARDKGGAIYCMSKTLTIEQYTDPQDSTITTDTVIRSCTATNEGGGVYSGKNADGTVLTVENVTIDTCSTSTGSGGGIYANSKTVSLTDSAVRNCHTTAADKNGGGVYLASSTTTTISGTTIQNCTATGMGGGVYHNAAGTLTVSNNSVISGNISQGMGDGTSCNGGGGIYTKALTVVLENSSLTDNQAAGNGGGICHNYYKDNDLTGRITVNGMTVTGNICGDSEANGGAGVGKGGGLYTLTNMTLKGITTITNNRLRTGAGSEENAAGVYLRDGVTLSLGVADGNQTGHVFNIKGNLTVDGKASDLRLPDKKTSGEIVNDNKVMVYCGIGGEVRVVNAKKKLTQFGTAQSGAANPAGFTDEHKVFLSETGSLFGIVDRQDESGTKIIWGGDPICKITDGNGRLLYIDANHVRPAVFDRLDALTKDNDSNYTTTSAFSTLRRIGKTDLKLNGTNIYGEIVPEFDSNAPYTGHLYYADGTKYTGNVYQVKMLIEEYEAEYYMNVDIIGGKDMTVILTTAKTSDTLFKYRGREGTSCTITRLPAMNTKYPMVTAKTNLTLTNIELVGNKNNVTATANTRLIKADSEGYPVLISLNRGAKLRDAKVNGNGGAIYLNYGAQLSIAGGSIRECEAENGGGVYIDGGDGAMTMTVGTITKCTATGNGGGVYFNKGKLTLSGTQQANGSSTPVSGFVKISGGNISRCEAQIGGGIYLNNGGNVQVNPETNVSESRHLYMSGGSVSSNHASQYGGGIAVGDEMARLYFSGAPYVYGNTSDSAAPQGYSVKNGVRENYSSSYEKADNVYMNRTFGFKADYHQTDNPGTVIVARGLVRGALVGVYVPGDCNYENGTSLYDKHGDEGDPFGTYDGSIAGLNYFVNDRNSMKGGLMEGQADGNKKVYWRKIYSLSVTKHVLSDNPDNEEKFRFRLELTGEIPITGGASLQSSDINGQFGDMVFTNGVTEFRLVNGETRSAEMLPLGFGYRVTEILTSAQKPLYKTTAENHEGIVGDGVDVEGNVFTTGTMNSNSTFIYNVTFSNLAAICKIVGRDASGNEALLYKNIGGTNPYAPAVYTVLVTAFNDVNKGENIEWYAKNESGGYDRFIPVSTRIEMLVPEYDTEGEASLSNGQKTTLTTASKDADDGFPYTGARGTAAVIKRGYTGESMITVDGSASLTLGSIVLDGGSTATTPYSSSGNGGILNVASGATLTVGTGAGLQNSTTTGNGAAIYLAQGGTMNISGGPVFANNVKTNVSLGTDPKNGGEVEFYNNNAPQDIYIAGYSDVKAASLVVTGDITSDPGSIRIWAEQAPHYVQNQQFAVMQGGPHSGLVAFRNAQTDETTQNPLRNEPGTPKYLYGIARGSDVYWSGSMDLTITKTVTGGFSSPLDGFVFTVTAPDLKNANCQCDYARYTFNGTEWEADTGTGATGKLTVSSDGTLTGTAASALTLKHNQKIVISVPRGTELTITEANGYYDASYTITGDQTSSGTGATKTTGSISMTCDTLVQFTNNLEPPSPTGYAEDIRPYLFMLLAGGLLAILAAACRRRARKG